MSNEARAALSDAELREHLTQEFCAAVAEESAYADQLRQAMVYIETLRHRKLEPTREAQSLFRSVHALWALHEQRALPPIAALNPLPERDAVDGEGRLQIALAKAVDTVASKLPTYVRHATLCDPVIAQLENASQPGTPLNASLQQTRAHAARPDDLPFFDLLRLPLDRLNQWATRLARVVLCTRAAEVNAVTRRALGVLEQLCRSQADALNASQLRQVAARIVGVPDARPIVAPGRQLLCDADMKINGKPYHVWLLSDRLVYAASKGKAQLVYKGEFDLANQTLIRNYVDTKTASNAFELVRIADQSSAVCVTSGPAAKRVWMTAITGAIKDHMRAAVRARQAAANDSAGADAANGPPSPKKSKSARVCEYCRVAPPVCKVMFSDGRAPLRACQACTDILNAHSTGSASAAATSAATTTASAVVSNEASAANSNNNNDNNATSASPVSLANSIATSTRPSSAAPSPLSPRSFTPTDTQSIQLSQSDNVPPPVRRTKSSGVGQSLLARSNVVPSTRKTPMKLFLGQQRSSSLSLATDSHSLSPVRPGSGLAPGSQSPVVSRGAPRIVTRDQRAMTALPPDTPPLVAVPDGANLKRNSSSPQASPRHPSVKSPRRSPRRSPRSLGAGDVRRASATPHSNSSTARSQLSPR
eukprot:CAMPEP_0168587438 /NCGR_PEP_ID=MMETSP0420-20121227/4877_1 /TAXON_ID=498008 /ORGANISM="Pessonella sp." /LENGTH=648 /DNA_ID=CAMNT_0008622715 /DNA_START=8 /DNA_END=1950 /DNA_ORIENTATION=-